MPARFASNLAIAVLGALLVTLSLTLAPAAAGWLAFGVGCATVLITLAAFATRGRGPAQRTLDLPLAAAGGWTIVASGAYTGHTLRWLSFAEGGALVGLAIVGLIAHEVLLERALSGATHRADDATATAGGPVAAGEANRPAEIISPPPARSDVAA